MREQCARDRARESTETLAHGRVERSVGDADRQDAIWFEQRTRGARGRPRIGQLIEAVPDRDRVERLRRAIGRQVAGCHREAERARELVCRLIDVEPLEVPARRARYLEKSAGIAADLE